MLARSIRAQSGRRLDRVSTVRTATTLQSSMLVSCVGRVDARVVSEELEAGWR